MPNFLQDCLIYRDDDVMVINKPAGLLSVPGKGEALTDSVQTRLLQEESKTLLVHRLDRDTSGILVFALNKAAQRHISIQFQQRQTEKKYHAIVEGHLSDHFEDFGEINVPVRYDEAHPPLHIADESHPKPAQSYYQIIENFYIQDVAVSRIVLKPITGRSHQLRVHTQYIGHPIVGDTLYATAQGQSLSKRLCLHAAELSFVHPVTGQTLNFVCQTPF